MQGFSLGSLRLEVEHRNPGPGGGPTLRVRDAASGHERLRFDCFERGAHWHRDPGGCDEITSLGEEVDALEWTLAELRRDLAGYVERAGGASGGLEPRETAAALDAVEVALRNPPVDFDAVRPSSRRPSRGEKWGLFPDDVLPLWVADMDFPVAEPIRRVLRRVVDRSDLGYPIHPAPTDLPEIAARRMERLYGWHVSPRRVEILNDVVQGMYVAISQLSEAGEGVVVQTPIYPPFLGSVETLRRRLVENPLALGPDGYRMDVDGLRAALDASTKLILLCNPHNPSGRAFTREELEALAEVVLRHDLHVVSDEIHQDLVWQGHAHVPFATLGPEIEARTITLTAASKAFNVAGLRCAVAIFGSDALKRRFNALPRHLRGGVSLPGFEGMRAAWLYGAPWLETARAYMQANLAYLVDFVREELPGVGLHPPDATYLAWLDCRALELDPNPGAFFLERARVALSDGAHFGEVGSGFARINFATSRAILAEALERMAKALR